MTGRLPMRPAQPGDRAELPAEPTFVSVSVDFDHDTPPSQVAQAFRLIAQRIMEADTAALGTAAIDAAVGGFELGHEHRDNPQAEPRRFVVRASVADVVGELRQDGD